MQARVTAGVAAASLALVLSGCTTADAETKTSAPSSLGLTGPWAEYFEREYAQAAGDYERKILSDGEITTAEYEQTKEHVRRCLGDSGLTITYDDRGGFELGSTSGKQSDSSFEKNDSILRQCEIKWEGAIRYLYERVRRNPENLDEATIQVKCLRAAGLVERSYTTKDWARDNEAGNVPSGDGGDRCAADPLGLWYDK